MPLATEDEVGRRQEGNHRDDVGPDAEVAEEVERIDRRTSGAKDKLPDDGAEDRKPGEESQESDEVLHYRVPI